MAANIITQAMLPKGWTMDDPYPNGVQILVGPDRHGFVSVDTDRRAWEMGSTRQPRFGYMSQATYQARYKGRGWLQVLINDAVAAIEAAWK